jgi:hypothetical protein
MPGSRGGDLEALRRENFRRLWRQRRVEAICSRGARAVWELVEELIRHRLVDEAEIDARLEAYAAADRVALAITGAHRMPAAPIHFVIARL